MTQPDTDTTPPYDRDAILDEDGPFNPVFMDEAMRTMIRALPLDPEEPRGWSYRRMRGAITALTALNPRDEIEVMLGVQAVSAYHAAAACWRLGMNLGSPNGNSTRHITTAASAARTFDSLLRAIERRQAKPLSVPVGRPAPQIWPKQDPAAIVLQFEERCRRGETDADPYGQPQPETVWTPEHRAATEALIEKERIEKENEGLDIANTEGILPGGGMLMPEDPTPNQIAYMGRRLAMMYRREYEENLRNGINKYPKIRGIRPGDLVP